MTLESRRGRRQLALGYGQGQLPELLGIRDFQLEEEVTARTSSGRKVVCIASPLSGEDRVQLGDWIRFYRHKRETADIAGRLSDIQGESNTRKSWTYKITQKKVDKVEAIINLTPGKTDIGIRLRCVSPENFGPRGRLHDLGDELLYLAVRDSIAMGKKGAVMSSVATSYAERNLIKNGFLSLGLATSVSDEIGYYLTPERAQEFLEARSRGATKTLPKNTVINTSFRNPEITKLGGRKTSLYPLVLYSSPAWNFYTSHREELVYDPTGRPNVGDICTVEKLFEGVEDLCIKHWLETGEYPVLHITPDAQKALRESRTYVNTIYDDWGRDLGSAKRPTKLLAECIKIVPQGEWDKKYTRRGRK